MANVLVQTDRRVRVLTLHRPEALNSFNDALYDEMTDELLAAAEDRSVAVVLITGEGRAFSTGADLGEMAARNAGQTITFRHGFGAFVDTLAGYPKPLVCAVNGMGIGIGATMLAYADLVYMARSARLRFPFTRLAVAPEAGSSISFPELIGHQRAAWMLLSSEWISADECLAAGLANEVVDDDQLMDVAMARAAVLAAKPIDSLVESKALMIHGRLERVQAARNRENGAFARLMGGPANREALAAFAERREPDFSRVDLES